MVIDMAFAGVREVLVFTGGSCGREINCISREQISHEG